MDIIPKDDIYTQLLSISNLFSNKYYSGQPQDENSPRNKITVRVCIRRVGTWSRDKTFYFNKNHNVNEFCLKLGYFICKDNTPIQIVLSHINCFNNSVHFQYNIGKMYIGCGWPNKRRYISERIYDICKILKNHYFEYIIPASLQRWNITFLWIWQYKRIQVNNKKYKLTCIFCNKDFIQKTRCGCVYRKYDAKIMQYLNNKYENFNYVDTCSGRYSVFPQYDGFTLKEIEKKYPEDKYIHRYIVDKVHKEYKINQPFLLLLCILRQYKRSCPIELLYLIIDFYPFDLQDCYLSTLY